MGTIVRRLGTNGQGQGVDKYIQLPDPLLPPFTVNKGTNPPPGNGPQSP